MAQKTTAVAVMSASEKTAKIADQRNEIRELKAENRSIIADYNKRVSKFVREELPTIATYAGAGAAFGGLLGYFLHDKMKEWFGADSYVALLGTAALGVVVVVATPSVIKVSRASLEKTGPMQAGMYGLGVGLIGAGGYLAYRDWPQA